ncbi:DinB family protein [Psychrobacillus lasiicapitis]|uniref:DinB family protein n=1 Tax=Psychrobacillus lasiicapitis TaxID=1636719 RepID=A0A544TB14_9BACI|nr:DinB family protein [Psychrobacillus lasiicapitis]TQR14558.1 DinB family protein [Psychrobacillus lasiicapitis]GGA30378.1 formate dehydrogenase [Psychrobacillus lasiicapitis]
MEQTILHHMETVRSITMKSIETIREEIADIVPEGFNNNIRWNFGHIAFVQERLVYSVLGEKMSLPVEYENFFGPGTKPADWQGTPPTLKEICSVLVVQTERIKGFVPERFSDKLPTPFTNRMGISFHTLGETLLFSFYHEAMHMETIKRIYKNISN